MLISIDHAYENMKLFSLTLELLGKINGDEPNTASRSSQIVVAEVSFELVTIHHHC